MDFNEESKFDKVLKNGVIGNSEEDKLNEERVRLVALLEEENNNVIKDPAKIKELEKQIREIDKKITKLEKTQPESEQDEEVLDDNKKAVEEKEKQQKEEEKKVDDGDESIVPPSDEEKLPEEESKEKGVEDEQALKEAYYNSLVAYYERVITDSKKQVANHEFVSSEEDFAAEIKLEKEMYKARDKYIALGKEDPYSEKRTELIRATTEAREPAEVELRRRAAEYRMLEIEMARLSQAEQELNDRLLSPEVNDVERENIKAKLEENSIKKRDIGVKLATVKEGLVKVNETREQRDSERAGLISKEIETLTSSDKANYRYQENLKNQMSNNITQAANLEYRSIKENLEAKEAEIRELSKELNNMSDSADIAKRIAIIEQLDAAINDRNTLSANLDARESGNQVEGQEAASEAKEDYDTKEYKSEELEKRLEEAKEHTAVIEEAASREAVRNPSPEDKSYTDGQVHEDIATAAVYTAVAVSAETPEEMFAGSLVGQELVEEEKKSDNPFMDNLKRQTRNVEDPKDAAEIVEAYEKANNALDDVARETQKEIG